jgi:hypothetical protein
MFFRSLFAKDRAHSSRSKRTLRLQLEHLETRLVPTCSNSFITGGVLTLNCDNSSNDVETYLDGAGEFREQIFRFRNGSGGFSTTGDFIANFSSIQINPGAGNNNVTIDTAARPLLVNSGGGVDDVFVGQNGLVFTAPITVQNPITGYTFLHVTDQNNPNATTATLTNSRLTLQSGGQTQEINYHPHDLRGLDIHLGSRDIVNVVSTPESGFAGGLITTVVGGTNTDTINVLATSTDGPLHVQGQSPNARVNVGNSTNGVQDINGGVNIQNSRGRTELHVDDTGDMRDHLMATQFLPGFGFDIISGLAPAEIAYRGVQTGAVTITLGSGNNTFTVENTNTAALLPTTLITGSGNAVNRVNVLGTTGPPALDVLGRGPNTTVILGNSTNGVQDIRGAVIIGNAGGRTTLSVDDTGDRLDQTARQKQDLLGLGFEEILGLAPAEIDYGEVQTGAVTITLGSGNNTFTFENTNTAGVATTTLNSGPGNNIVNVLRTTEPLHVIGGGGPDNVNIGNAGSLAGILGAISVSNPPANGFTALTINDQADTVGRAISVSNSAVSFGGVPISYEQSGLRALTVNAGIGDNIFMVASLPNSGFAGGLVTTLNGGGGTNTLQGPNTPTGFNIAGRNAGTLTSGGVGAFFSNFQNLTGGSGGDNFTFADGAGIDGNINDSGAANTLDYSAYSTDVYANLQTGAATGVAGGIASIQNVTGGQGNNILVGNGGNVLTVFGGHNLVIAGGSASTLNGGNGTNILIGGTTDYDADFASLRAILDFWNTVTPDNYDDSVNALLAGTGVPPLNTNTVHSNGGGNQFSGGALNLYFGSHDSGLDTFDPDPPNGRVIEI